MLYKPNFCCSCGEKVLRSKWGLLTSRRFCEYCETEHMGHEYFVRVMFGVALVGILFGASAFIPRKEVRQTSATSSTAVPVQRQALAAAPAKAEPRTETTTNGQAALPPTAPAGPAVTQVGPVLPRPAARAENRDTVAHFCGAPTKKGTPCSRRVKTKGALCWQHAGSM